MLMGDTVEISQELYREFLVKQTLVNLAGGEDYIAAMLPVDGKNEFLKFKSEVESGEHDPVKVDY